MKFITACTFLVTVAYPLFNTQSLFAQSCCSNHKSTYCRVDNSGHYGIADQNYCSELSACSIDHDLSGASGEELKRYEQEKSQDGQTFSNWRAPDFTLPTTEGGRVSLSDYRGKPVVLIFMSGHCSHCMDTHDILPGLQEKYAAAGLVVLPVYINSGSVADVQDWSRHMDLNYALLVSRGADISGMYDSKMVPSFFFISGDGMITKKFVGYKSKTTLDKAFAELANGQSS